MIAEADSLYSKDTLQFRRLVNRIDEEATRNNYDLGRSYAIFFKSMLSEQNQNKEITLAIYKKALTMAEDVADTKLQYKVYYQLGLMHEKYYESEQALNAFQAAYSFLQNSVDTLKTAETLTKIGLIYWENGNLKEAGYNFQKALRLRKAIGDKMAVSGSLNNLGAIFFKQGNYKDALKNFLESLQIRKQTDNYEEISVSLNNVGLIYQKLQYYEKAKTLFLEAKDISNSCGYNFGQAYSLYNLGQLYKDLDTIVTSNNYFKESLELSDKFRFRNLNTLTINHIAKNYEILQNYNQAYRLYIEAADSAKSINDKFALATVYSNLAKIYQHMNRRDSALKYIDLSQAIALRENLREILKDNYYQKFEIYSEMNNVLAALENYKIYSEINDKIMNENLVNNITNMLIKAEIQETEAVNKLLLKEKLLAQSELENQRNLRNYIIIASIMFLVAFIALLLLYRMKKNTSDKIEQQNIQLELLITELNTGNITLKKMIATRDKLFSIIAHDLRNPLNVILNYAGLLRNSSDHVERSEIKEYSDIINNSGEAMASLINNLLNWARNQLDQIQIDKRTFSLNELIQKVITAVSAKALYKEIEIIQKIDKEYLVKADTDMIESVVRNLLSNALKFSNRHSEILISAEEEGDFIRLLITDHGIGIEKNVAESIFSDSIVSHKGTENESGSGLGLNICKEFISRNGGEINFTSEPGKSTVFWFTIPRVYKLDS